MSLEAASKRGPSSGCPLWTIPYKGSTGVITFVEITFIKWQFFYIFFQTGISAERIIGGNEQLPASSTGTALFTHHPYQIATLSIWILTLDHLFRLLNFHQYYEFCRITSSY